MSLFIKHPSASQAYTRHKSQAITNALSLNNRMKIKKTRVTRGNNTRKGLFLVKHALIYAIGWGAKDAIGNDLIRRQACAMTRPVAHGCHRT